MIEKYHQKESLNIQTLDLLTRTARIVLKYVDTYFSIEAGISSIRFIVLHALSMRKEATSLSDLVALTNTNHNNITALIDRMKREGLVTARRARKDRRVIHVKLTPKGTEIAGKSMIVVKNIADRVLSSLGDDDIATLMRQLSTINRNVSGSTQERDSPE